jgi:signal transduction histidine kinase/ActR/RegA family two-component response regulator
MFQIYGLPPKPDGLSYEDWRARVLPDDLAEQEAQVQRTVATCGHDEREFRIMRASDQAVRFIQANEIAIAGADGRTALLIGINIDITDRKREKLETQQINEMLEQRVCERTKELQFRNLILSTQQEVSIDGILVVDGDVRIVSCNGQFARMWGIPPELVEKKDNQLLLNFVTSILADPPAFLQRVQSIYEHRRETSREEINLKDARIFDCYSAPMFGLDDQYYGRVWYFRDITERKKSQRLAMRSQRIESIGTLAGGVAHDLNNALAPIMMGVEMLRMQYPNDSDLLDILATSARRGADMVKQLLSFARGAEGEHVLLQPARLITELEKLVRGTFPKNIQLVVKCDPELPQVLGDPTQLHQVLLNLCVNARDAMPQGGTLTLEAKGQEVDAIYASSEPGAKPGKYVALRVKDTGIGIPPEVLDRIFEPFFTTKGPDKGTGLGLANVMGIVKGHGGFLQVHSQPGKGSMFTAYVPVNPAGNEMKFVTKTAMEFHGQGETILLVEDEAMVRRMMHAVLRHLNCNPLIATDGADGLVQAALNRTALRAVITDLDMPYMDGLAFVRALRRMLPDIPIMVASGRMEDTVVEEFKSLGVTRFLDKPFTEEQLAEALKNLLAPK